MCIRALHYQGFSTLVHLSFVHSQEYYHLKLLTEVKLNIGPLEANLRSVAELLLQTYYLLMGYEWSVVTPSHLPSPCTPLLELSGPNGHMERSQVSPSPSSQPPAQLDPNHLLILVEYLLHFFAAFIYVHQGANPADALGQFIAR